MIAFVIFIVLSPLAWLKSSPGQERITAFRKRALALGLKVQVVPPLEAAPEDNRPTAVRYALSLGDDDSGDNPFREWSLIRGERRGWASPWQGWRWLHREAPAQLHPAIGEVVSSLPESVNGLRAEPHSVSLYVREVGDIETVDRYADALRRLAQQL